MTRLERTILLFDVDGTLTKSRNRISDEMHDFLLSVRKHVHVGVVGGSDLPKVVEQLGDKLSDVLANFDCVFTENGVVGFRGKEKLPGECMGSRLGENRLQELLNFCLDYIAKLRIPVKRGTFIEYRKGMINISPIGRNCTQEERDAFVEYDAENKVRARFVDELRKRFSHFGLTFAIGGQISIDAFPNGWDKTYCLKYLTSDYDSIHFFGDRTEKGGNDYELYAHDATIGHAVRNPEHTKQVVTEVLGQIDIQLSA